MKRIMPILLAALLLAELTACGLSKERTAEPAAVDLPSVIPEERKAPEAKPAVRRVGGYAVVRNDDERKTTYPFRVRTESAVWYLSSADMERMGEDAFYAGLEDVLKFFELDAADARKALTGRIPDEIPPVEIRTDFSDQDDDAERYGAKYNQPFNLIKLFHGWQTVKRSLLHEYVHYLTFSCAGKKTPYGFYGEAVAEYVSMIVCENRMCRSDQFGFADDPEQIESFRAWGVWDEEKDNLDYRKYVLCESDAFARGLYDDLIYVSVGQNVCTRTAGKRLPARVNDLSYGETVSLALYLIETYGEETFLDRWDLPGDQVAATFLDRQGPSARKTAGLNSLSESELLTAWAAWNAEQCAALGIRMELTQENEG